MKSPGPEAPVVLVKWYDFAEWELECVNLAEELENGTYRPGAYRYFNQTTTIP